MRPCRAGCRTELRSTWPRPKTRGWRTSTEIATSTLPEASDASMWGIVRSPCLPRSVSSLDRFLHTCVQVTPYENYVRLAERMNEVTPGKFPKKTLFVNTGAEAVENAVKIARAHTGRPSIIAFEDAFHGRTMMTLALTSKTHPYKAGFAPFPGDVYRIPYAYCYRCSYALKYPSCDLYCARHLEDTFKRVVASEDVAAVIAEPVLGEGGFVVPPPDFYRILIDICHKHGVLFIADEVQSGFGRTGTLFASEHYGIEPDILVLRQVDWWRLATGRNYRTCGNYGRAGSGRFGWNLCRKSGLLCRRARRPRSVRPREPAGPCQRSWRSLPEARPRNGRSSGPSLEMFVV